MFEADSKTDGTPRSFVMLTALTFAGSLDAALFAPPTFDVPTALVPILFTLGAYLAICSTFFPTFAPFQSKVARLAPFYGEETAQLITKLGNDNMLDRCFFDYRLQSVGEICHDDDCIGTRIA